MNNTIDNRKPEDFMVTMNRSSSDIANEFYAEHL